MYERVKDSSLPEGCYYAHISVLDLTTHGLGIDGAREAARDLITVWIEEKRANGESVPVEGEALYSTVEIADVVHNAHT